MKFVSGSSCLQLSDQPFPCQEQKRQTICFKPTSPVQGWTVFISLPYSVFSGTEIEIMLSWEINRFPFMAVDIFGCWDLGTCPCMTVWQYRGKKHTSAQTTWGCLACQNGNHISKSLSNPSCDCCMSSVLWSGGAEPGVSEDNERKLVGNLEWTWFQRSIHTSMEDPSSRIRLTGFIRAISKRASNKERVTVTAGKRNGLN